VVVPGGVESAGPRGVTAGLGLAWWLPLGVAVLLLGAGCAHNVPSGSAHNVPSGGGGEEGEASWYGPGLYGRKTASGEVLRPGSLTAAHRTLPFGTCLRVTNLENGRVVEVRVNDRGPYAAGRIVDVSETAARALGMHGRGVTRVRLDRCSGNATLELEEPGSPLAQVRIEETAADL
jgi:rare lipoprotein A